MASADRAACETVSSIIETMEKQELRENLDKFNVLKFHNICFVPKEVLDGSGKGMRGSGSGGKTAFGLSGFTALLVFGAMMKLI